MDNPPDNPSRPLIAVLGGAKVSDKIGVIESFQRSADTILIGGAMCFPFFKAPQGHPVGLSLCADEDVELAGRLLRPARRRPRATDRRCPAILCWPTTSGRMPCPAAGAHRRARRPDGAGHRPAHRADATRADPSAGTVFWNGPMGAFELEPFAAGTRAIAEALAAAHRRRPSSGAATRRRARALRSADRSPTFDRRRRDARADRRHASCPGWRCSR